MPLSNQLRNQHLLWRAGFGPAVEQLNDLRDFTPKEFYRALVKESSKKPVYMNVADNYLKGLVQGIGVAGQLQRKELSADERRNIQRKNREGVRNLNITWMNEMVNSGAQLREKMAFFWHGHFACRNLNVFYQQELLNVIRQNALGNFGTLLKEVSRSAAMLFFLNNQQNRKGHPNENFAREVMELFTLGRGNYSENDVKEAARAFTGWGANVNGEFVFRKGQHDNGTKTVLGHTGQFDGDAVLNILLDEKQTARFICTKIYKFFVNDAPDQQRIQWLADRFYQKEYDISSLLEDIYTSDWFYDEKNVSARIKSPVELLVGIQRMLPMALQNEDALLVIQRILGQVLFYPPNVAGWPGGRSWIDSSTLMMRMRVPQLFNDEDEINIKPKDDDDQMMGRKDDGEASIPAKPRQQKIAGGRGTRLINANIEWTAYTDHFSKTQRELLVNAIAGILLQTNTAVGADIITKYSDGSSREAFIRSATIQLMSTPEYQLC
ncbi:DUF1800 domain-containing protein [Terrimonas sp. NA20]|uniref:DUF1800 domain-containing protein n=1 Tax=Terrimonas ginsenosidimutans TaxID=2908004 RepID=A0ABS9KQ77_9BACT|nr:DUF1800 domain-containing protein [Terrimonas ginsenosidimutans]MCG2614484.1 DUF1800 domain-containing protein [Terrimonas ginsenosidimutans]